MKLLFAFILIPFHSLSQQFDEAETQKFILQFVKCVHVESIGQDEYLTLLKGNFEVQESRVQNLHLLADSNCYELQEYAVLFKPKELRFLLASGGDSEKSSFQNLFQPTIKYLCERPNELVANKFETMRIDSLERTYNSSKKTLDLSSVLLEYSTVPSLDSLDNLRENILELNDSIIDWLSSKINKGYVPNSWIPVYYKCIVEFSQPVFSTDYDMAYFEWSIRYSSINGEEYYGLFEKNDGTWKSIDVISKKFK